METLRSLQTTAMRRLCREVHDAKIKFNGKSKANGKTRFRSENAQVALVKTMKRVDSEQRWTTWSTRRTPASCSAAR